MNGIENSGERDLDLEERNNLDDSGEGNDTDVSEEDLALFRKANIERALYDLGVMQSLARMHRGKILIYSGDEQPEVDLENMTVIYDMFFVKEYMRSAVIYSKDIIIKPFGNEDFNNYTVVVDYKYDYLKFNGNDLDKFLADVQTACTKGNFSVYISKDKKD